MKIYQLLPNFTFQKLFFSLRLFERGANEELHLPQASIPQTVFCLQCAERI